MKKYILPLLFVSSVHAGPTLIGGKLATKDEFKSTVRVNRSCTGSKIGSKTFLFASHCFVNTSIADISSAYKKGMKVALDTHYGVSEIVTINNTYPHPTYIAEIKRRLAAGLSLSGGALVSFDIGVFTVEEETPSIPAEEVDTDKVLENDEVVIGGYGCGVRTNSSEGGGSYKIQHTQVVGESAAPKDHYGRDVSKANQFNFYTKGQKLEATHASICPGDSGGPVYRERNGGILGVNSQYIFKDDSGVSLVNTHTRVSEVAEWLQGILND